MTSLTRRSFLILGTGLVVSACSPSPPLPAVHTVKDLLSTTPFYIAHRGSGDNWPEHTAAAYRNAVAAGAKALEISVQATKDGVLVCHHDLNILRMTGVDLEIASVTYADLKGVLNNARQWLGPRSLLLPIPLLKDVLDEHAAHRVIFIEDKQGTNTEALLKLMDSYTHSKDHFIWKQPAGSMRFRVAKARGYATWGYFAPEDFGNIDKYADRFDYVGIYHTASVEVVKKLVAKGKPVICWEIHTRSLRDTMLNSGVRGMMCSNFPYVTEAKPKTNYDAFATGVRAAGDLPAVLEWSRQPRIVPETSSVVLEGKDKSSYCMGSVCPVQGREYTLQFDMSWPDGMPADYEHSGIAFGQPSDAAYLVREASTVSGYHVVLRGNGSLELFVRKAGTVSGQSLGQVKTDRPVAGVWMSFQVRVTPDNIRVERTDGSGGHVSANDGRYRGGYFSLCRNYDSGPGTQFRGVAVG